MCLCLVAREMEACVWRCLCVRGENRCLCTRYSDALCGQVHVMMIHWYVFNFNNVLEFVTAYQYMSVNAQDNNVKS